MHFKSLHFHFISCHQTWLSAGRASTRHVTLFILAISTQNTVDVLPEFLMVNLL